MLTINATVRSSIRRVLVSSREFDASTMRISRDGMVTARKDADKTFVNHDASRYNVAYAEDMVRQDGAVREGW